MDARSVQLYLEILKDGKEERRDIRIIIVGKKGSGKTSLTRRLLKESLEGIKPTNGIEIHVKRCCIRTEDGTWITKDGKEIDNVFKSRILEQIVQTAHKDKKEEGQVYVTDQTTAEEGEERQIPNQTPIEQGKEHGMNKKSVEDGEETHADVANQTFAEKRIRSVVGENNTSILYEREDNQLLNVDESKTTILNKREENQLLDDLQQVLQAPFNKEKLANVFLWDFAGDEEFYNTHQIFLAKDVIYVVVTNLGDKYDDEPGAFKFWFDSVHCYVGSTPGKDEQLLPPIIVVGTHTDKYQGNDLLCYKDMAVQLDNISQKLKRHIHGSVLLSNTDDPDLAVDTLRKKLLEIAKQGNTWNIELPLKFVLLEEALQDHIELETPILPLKHIQIIAKCLKQPITDADELDLFLHYQHEIGSLVYFADIPEYIVLDTQWLADAFRCIISAEKFLHKQVDMPNLEWKEFQSTGRVNKEILDAIFSKQSKVIQENKDFILILMERFDLLVRPKTTDTVLEDYYVPCMVRKVSDDVAESFFPDIKEKTHCLCLSYDFLPPPVFVQLVAVCCKKQDFCSSKISIEDKGYPAFFKDVAVFDICQSGCEKLLIARKDNVIQLQVWKFGEVTDRSYEYIRKIITDEIERLLKERFRLSNVPYKEMIKCPETKYNTLVGMREYITYEYLCEEHQKTHKFKDDWFGIQRPTTINNEHMNCMRIGWITLNILADVLYDLLKMEARVGSVGLREDYDVSELYQEHYRLNKRKLPKGWKGKTLADVIQTNIEDDIERIRLIRNQMQHASHYTMDDRAFTDLFDIIKDILHRFDIFIKPTGKLYCDRAEDVKHAIFPSSHNCVIIIGNSIKGN